MKEEFEIGQRVRLDGHIYLVERLMRGGMGLVLLCSRADCTVSELYRSQIATKVFFPNQDQQQIRKELQLWQRLHSPHIVPLLAVGHVNDWLCAAMPWYTDGAVSFEGLRKSGGPSAVKNVLQQMCHALDSAWTQNVLHLDVKPSNILRRGNTYAMADWGIARIASVKAAKRDPSTGGTLPYMAPERFFEEPRDICADVYALGMSAFELVFGVLPFEEQTYESLVGAILSGKASTRLELLTVELPESWRLLIRSCCAFDSASRPQSYRHVRQLVDALET
ncbi:MAG TPA: serine/threonine-protein kinase [Rubrivivax sp.]|nr:serine/threonine-protein kinase [Rubrivivax sp.]